MVLEFTINDNRDANYTDSGRRGYEQLIRKLMALPSRCGGRWRPWPGAGGCGRVRPCNGGAKEDSEYAGCSAGTSVRCKALAEPADACGSAWTTAALSRPLKRQPVPRQSCAAIHNQALCWMLSETLHPVFPPPCWPPQARHPAAAPLGVVARRGRRHHGWRPVLLPSWRGAAGSVCAGEPPGLGYRLGSRKRRHGKAPRGLQHRTRAHGSLPARVRAEVLRLGSILEAQCLTCSPVSRQHPGNTDAWVATSPCPTFACSHVPHVRAVLRFHLTLHEGCNVAPDAGSHAPVQREMLPHQRRCQPTTPCLAVGRHGSTTAPERSLMVCTISAHTPASKPASDALRRPFSAALLLTHSLDAARPAAVR